jgi:hypothetical protein
LKTVFFTKPNEIVRSSTWKKGVMFRDITTLIKDYKAFEMSVSEGLNLQATAKVGIKPVYGIFSVGTQFLAENYKWAFGAGVGTHLMKTEDHSMNLEYMIFHVNENEIWTDNYNNFQQIRRLH